MGLKTELLHESLVKLLEDIGYGGLSYVARQASLTAAGVKKIKEKDGVPKLESWEKLHNAFPHQIPPPGLRGSGHHRQGRRGPRGGRLRPGRGL